MAKLEYLVREPKTTKPNSKKIPGNLLAFAAKANQTCIDIQLF
jgi:hypothetical protein